MVNKVTELKREIASAEANVEALREMEKGWLQLRKDALNADSANQTLFDDIQTELKAATDKLETLQKRLEIELKKSSAEPEAPVPESKWDRSKHPVLGAQLVPKEPEKLKNFEVGDAVEVKWTDRVWYKAKVTTVTGSTDNPRYTVKFKDYPETYTVDRDNIRAASGGTKRKAEEPAVTVSPPIQPAPIPQSSATISAAPNLKPVPETPVDPAALLREQPKKFRKIANNKKLKANQSNWKDFLAKGPKAVKKESMFRTGDAFGARVGVTGSGKAMTKEAVRTKNRYQVADEDEEAYN